MADSASELESDTSSVDGGPVMKMTSPGQVFNVISVVFQLGKLFGKALGQGGTFGRLLLAF